MYNVMDEEITTRLWSILETYMTKSLSNKLYLKKQPYELLFGHIYCIIVTAFLYLFCNNSYNSLVLISKFMKDMIEIR